MGCFKSIHIYSADAQHCNRVWKTASPGCLKSNVSNVMPIAGCLAVSSSIMESPCMFKVRPRLPYRSTALSHMQAHLMLTN